MAATSSSDRSLGWLGLTFIPLLVYAIWGIGHRPSALDGPGHWTAPYTVDWIGAQWIGALASAGGAALLLAYLFRLRANQIKGLIVMSLFAAGIAVVLCLLLQLMSIYPWTPGRGRGRLVTSVCRFIGYSYRAGIDPHASFLSASLSFFFGMGLFEGVVKATPLLLFLRGRETLSIRDAVLWGLSSGAAVGAIEAASYASTIFPRFSGVTFISSVGVHAILNGLTALIAWKREEDLEAAEKGVEWFFVACVIVAGATLLHTFYDTFLKRDEPWGALGVAVASLAALLFLRRHTELWARRLTLPSRDLATGTRGGGQL